MRWRVGKQGGSRAAVDGDKTPDSPRYRALGNAVCVNVVRWIAQRMIATERGSYVSFHNRKEVNRTRKPHRCSGCLETIPAGSKATYHAWANGNFGYYYLCVVCQEYADKHDDYLDCDGMFADGDIGEARRERERWEAARN